MMVNSLRSWTILQATLLRRRGSSSSPHKLRGVKNYSDNVLKGGLRKQLIGAQALGGTPQPCLEVQAVIQAPGRLIGCYAGLIGQSGQALGKINWLGGKADFHFFFMLFQIYSPIPFPSFERKFNKIEHNINRKWKSTSCPAPINQPRRQAVPTPQLAPRNLPNVQRRLIGLGDRQCPPPTSAQRFLEP